MLEAKKPSSQSPSAKIRVLIVDDSEFMRHLLKSLLQAESDIEVVGEAKNGLEAVERAESLQPDVITMDYNMPELHGAEAAEMIIERSSGNPPKIIILSAYSEEAVFETFRSLEKGAVGFIRKPSGELSLDIEKVQDELLRLIRVAAEAKVVIRAGQAQVPSQLLISGSSIKAELVVIGASTGGPPVIERLLSDLGANFPAALAVVQHMPLGFTKGFADYLARNSQFKVIEAEDGIEIRPGLCLIAPSGQHLRIEERSGRKVAALFDGEKVSGYRPSIDVLMESAAKHYPEKCLGIILTGMGHDGQEGMRSLRQAGGYTIVQSPETAAIETMPRSIINNHLAEEILSPHLIAARIKELV